MFYRALLYCDSMRSFLLRSSSSFLLSLPSFLIGVVVVVVVASSPPPQTISASLTLPTRRNVATRSQYLIEETSIEPLIERRRADESNGVKDGGRTEVPEMGTGTMPTPRPRPPRRRLLLLPLLPRDARGAASLQVPFPRCLSALASSSSRSCCTPRPAPSLGVRVRSCARLYRFEDV